MSNNTNDDALMAAVARGEETAFRLLVHRWEREVRAFLIHMLSSVEEAEDLTQDTFVQVFNKADGYQGEGKFQSWLFRIAGNLARSKLRRRKILGWVSFNPDIHDKAGTGDDPAKALVKKNEAQIVHSALSGLPQRQRQALVLHRFQGLKYKEIAEAMDISVSAVESLIQRAMGELRQTLKGKVDRS